MQQLSYGVVNGWDWMVVADKVESTFLLGGLVFFSFFSVVANEWLDKKIQYPGIFIKLLRQIFRIDILNPKAAKILKDLADINLMAIQDNSIKRVCKRTQKATFKS